MALIGANGGLIGTQRSTNSSTAPGLWTPYEQVLLRRAGQWPLSGDPCFAYNSLLLHMDGTNGSTTFTDTSSNALTVTANGNAQISTAQSKFGGASALFDGSGDYLSCTLGALGTNDFTIEAWVRPSSFANYRMIYDTRTSDGDTSGFVWGINSSGGLFIYRGSFVLTTGTLTTNTWAHVALSRSSGTWRIFKDGVLQSGTYSSSGDLTRTATRIGMDWATLYGFDGYIDDLRITNGVARYTANFTPPIGAFLDVGTGGDPYFPTTSVLLHMDGTNGSTIFPDNGVDSRAITANGGVTVSTAQSKYGGASAFFNGTTDSLSFSDPGLGTGNFTIELWFRTASSVQYAQFIGNESSGYTLVINNSSSTSGDIGLYALGSLVCATSGIDYGDDAWHHLAVTRSGTAVTIWVDGVSRATGTSSATFSGQTNFVGRNNAFSPRNLIGYIDDLRITKGIARYTGSFTPPTTAFPDVGTGGDPYFLTTSLLLHMDGTNGSTIFTDSSSNALTLTANGNAQISTAQSKFGGASGYFDGTVDNLTVSSAVLNIASSEDYTWEGWFYATSTGGYKCIINNDFGFSGNPRLYLKNNNLLGYIDSNDRISHQTTVTTNTWNHFAMVRASNTVHVYLNGVQSSTSYTYSAASSNDMRIGSDSGVNSQDFAGYLDDIRVTKGVARYTATFTPPIAALPEAGTGIGDNAFAYNSLLLHMDGTNGSTTFTDTSSNALTITPSGNAQISIAQSKFGGASGLFDGAGDYLQASSTPSFNFPGDFTIELWVRPEANVTNAGLIIRRILDTSGTGTWGLQINGGTATFSNLQTVTNTTFGTVPLNVWTHIAVSRSGSSMRLFLNGTLNATVTDSTSFTSTQALYIGVWGGTVTTPNTGFFNGYIDDLRITAGFARYTGSFTPPTAAFPNA